MSSLRFLLAVGAVVGAAVGAAEDGREATGERGGLRGSPGRLLSGGTAQRTGERAGVPLRAAADKANETGAETSTGSNSTNETANETGLETKVNDGSWRLDWAAQGESFFDGWTFLNDDVNHGSAEYLSKADAFNASVVQAHSTHAILRAGGVSPQYEYKRQSARIQSNKQWDHFLVTMKYDHVPFGCGVWPALFTLGDGEWPQAGEIDILEYVNNDYSKSSVHFGESCTLDRNAVNKYGGMPDRNQMNYQCLTAYPDQLGCAPNKWMRTGEGWTYNPGVVALEWTSDHIKMYMIPKWEIPEDLKADSPKPDTWDKWLYSYYPLKESGCPATVMKPQRLLMQIGFCGDWASKVWHLDSTCKPVVQNCRSVDPLREYAPKQDCCTKFIWDEDKSHRSDEYLAQRAFFNISYLKVFTQR